MADGQVFSGRAVEILERMAEGFYAIDVDWRLVYINASAETYWGRLRADLLDRSMFDLFPAFAGSRAHEAHKQAFAQRAPVRAEVVSTATGRPVELSIYPDDAGGLSVYFYDISSRRDLERRLRERDELLSLAELSAGIGVWDSDLASQTLHGTPQFFGLHGLEPTDEPVPFAATRALRHPEDRDRVVAGFDAAIASGADNYETEYRIIRPDGQTRWIFGRGRVIRDAAGKPIRYSGIDIDITDRKRQEDQLRLVTHELRHRANNLLAVIQAMARQTLRASVSLEDFETRFDGRVRALAESNELLVHQDWRGVPLDTLVRGRLVPFADRDTARLFISGPKVDVVPKAVQTLGLALHELATNASKYGALSTDEGQISVTWEVRSEGGERRFGILWRESGGPPVEPPKEGGFGRFVIETMVAQNLNASVAIGFDRRGLVWTVDCRAGDIVLD
jgi:PAS domain S-box-containing protein